MTFVVTTPSFSGPVELLLQLISSHDVDVLDVPLGPIVDAFVAALRDDMVTIDVEGYEMTLCPTLMPYLAELGSVVQVSFHGDSPDPAWAEGFSSVDYPTAVDAVYRP